MRRSLAILTAALGAALASAGTAGAATLHISTEGGETLAGLPFRGGDVVEYDDSPPGAAALFFNEDWFTGPTSEDVDAFELLPNGDVILSTPTNATLGGLNFDSGDLVRYDPLNDLATLIFDGGSGPGGLFGPGGGDIDAVAVLPNGHILISTDATETLGGVSFRDGDVVEWDPITQTANPVLFFNEDAFGSNVNLDAFDVTSDGLLAISHFENPTTTLGGLTINNGDVVLYDINTDTATFLFLESTFSTAPANVDAVAVPEPGTSALLALGLLGLAFAGRRRPR